MMRGRCVLLAGACSGVLLLGGCVPSSDGDSGAAGYGYSGVAGQGYGYPAAGGAQGYPGVEAPGYGSGPPPGGPYAGPDGLSYVEGVPVGAFEGEQVPLVFVGGLGGWGYYDRERGWHGAPPELRERLERAHPGGRGLPPPEAYRSRFDRADPDRAAGRPFVRDGLGGPEHRVGDEPGTGPERERVFRGGVERGGPDRPADRGPGFGFGPPGGGLERGRPGGGRPDGRGADRFRSGAGEPGRFGPGEGRPGMGEQAAGRRDGVPGGLAGQAHPGAVQGFGNQGPGGQGPGRPGLGGPGPEGPRPGSQGRPVAPPRPAPSPPPRACAPGQARC